MNKSEKRNIRRQVINYCINKMRDANNNTFVFCNIKNFVRFYEKKNYGKELKYAKK